MTNGERKVLNIGFLGAGGKLTIDGAFLSYQHPYGKKFRVPIKDIQTASVDELGWGKAMLKIIGSGTALAQAKMPVTWAQKCQEWVLSNK